MNLDLKFYVSLFLRRIHYFLLIAVAVGAIGISIATILPTVYQAQARLLVESAQIPGDLAASTVSTGAKEQLQIIQQRLTTRANILDLAKRLNVYAERDTMAADDIVNDMRSRLQISTTGGTSSSGRGPASALIVTISFDAPKPEKAAEVANEFVTLVLQENVALRTSTAGQTLDFFKQEVARLDAELAQRSATILDFKLKNKDALPDSLEYRRTRQAQQQELLLRIQRDESALQDRRTRLVDLYERTGRVDTGVESTTPEQKQLQTLKDELATALIVYSASNPRVKVLQAKVAALEDTVNAQLAASQPDGQTLSPYELQLADIDGQITYLANQRTEVEADLAFLLTSIEATPKNAIELAVLQRDYDAVSDQYNQAVDRQAKAETGDRLEALSKGQRITVLEQANVPRDPVRPPRKLIAAGGVGAGIILGLGFIALLEMMNRSIRRPIELTTKLGITAFATLPYMRTQRETRNRRILISGALLFVLIGIPGGLWALHTYYLPMDMLIDMALKRSGLAPLIDQLRQGMAQG